MPTLSTLAGAKVLQDRVYDGYDLSPLLKGQDVSPREEMFFYHGNRLFAVRKGDYKLYYYSNNPIGYPEKVQELEKPKLYNLSHDPSERFDVIDQHPEVVADIQALVETHRSKMVFGETQLEKLIGENPL